MADMDNAGSQAAKSLIEGVFKEAEKGEQTVKAPINEAKNIAKRKVIGKATDPIKKKITKSLKKMQAKAMNKTDEAMTKTSVAATRAAGTALAPVTAGASKATAEVAAKAQETGLKVRQNKRTKDAERGGDPSLTDNITSKIGQMTKSSLAIAGGEKGLGLGLGMDLSQKNQDR